MAEIRGDHNVRIPYEFNGPSADLQQDRSKVRLPSLVESIGTDGRFLGAIRPFPGFADDEVHGLPYPGVDTTITNQLSNIQLVKYASIQKGLGKEALRGLVILADNVTNHSLVGGSTGWSWRLSSATGGNAYYVHEDDDAALPGNAGYVVAPSSVTFNGVTATRNDAGVLTDPITLGDMEWGWGRNAADPIPEGTSTIYARVFAGILLDPDSLASGYVTAVHSGQALYFVHWDSETGLGDAVLLEDLTQVQGYSTLTDYDIACNGKYIYLVGRTEEGKRFNRAYWYDFEYTSWQTATDGIASRFMGIYYGDNTYQESDDPSRLAVAESASAGHLTAGEDYVWGVELANLKHNIRSRLARVEFTNTDKELAEVTPTSLTPSRRVDGGDTFASGRYIDLSSQYWGMQTWDTFFLWRSLSQELSGSDPANYELLGSLYLENIATKSTPDFVQGGAGAFVFPVSNIDLLGGLESTDLALARTIGTYNPFVRDVGEVPPCKRIACLDGMTVLAATPETRENPELDWSYSGSLPESLRFSSVVMGEEENFPLGNVYHPSEPGEQMLSLERVGSYVMAVSTGAVYRSLQNGTQVATTALHRGVGGVSRYGQTAVGNSLFLLTRSGFKEIDGNTGSIRSLSALDRMIFDEREWGNTLDSVHVSYDHVAGCLILLNTSLKEMVLLWEATGAVTTLIDCPWEFVVSGPDVTTGGNYRAYFITSDGFIHVIDAAREMDKRSMCGTTADEVAVGTLASSLTFQLTLAPGQKWPSHIVGFRVYILDGPLAGESAFVSQRNSDTIVTMSSVFSANPTAGTRVSVAPVVFRVTAPQFVGEDRGGDLFLRKRVKSISAALTNIDVEDDATGSVGCYKRTTKLTAHDVELAEPPDQCVAYLTDAHGSQLYPYFETYWANSDFELQAFLLKGVVPGNDAESRMAVTT